MNKKELRAYGRQIRSEIPDMAREAAKAALYNNIVSFLSKHILTHNLIGTYYPYGGEIYPPHHIDGFETALPVIRNGITLEFYTWEPGEPLVKRDFDIPIPDTRGKAPVFPAAILLPLVLCDTYGNRIGQGAGHYDRYIASLDYKPVLIGVCFEEQVYPEALPAEPHDVRLDAIITPKRVIGV